MNIEELELSLRSEFEGQMGNVIARMRQEVSELQNRFDAEFQKQRELMDASFADIVSRMPESISLDSSLKSSITEHLRLARDEGAQIAATAFGEAEKLRTAGPSGTSVGGHDLVRDAINDISSKRSQAAILTALVEHASHFAARGAFFILKNDNFMGWKLFGEAAAANEAVREVNFSAKSGSMLTAAVNSLATVRSAFGERVDDINFLEPLQFGEPTEMYAVPLSARGRGVAVLYADRGGDDNPVNLEALETLVRVAGLTVELLAAAQTARPHAESAEAQTQAENSADAPQQKADEQPQYEFKTETFTYEEAKAEEAPQEAAAPEYVEDPAAAPAEHEVESTAYAYDAVVEPASADQEAVAEYEFETSSSYEFEPTATYEPVQEVEQVETDTYAVEAVEEATFVPAAELESSNGFEFSSGESYGNSYSVDAVESPSAEVPHVEFAVEEAAVVSNGNGHVAVAETIAAPVQPEMVVAEAAPAPEAKPRLRDRNMDLPIEVADDERKLHNDARRFARLLVSEIKLYNEKEVTDGRVHSDLYIRLKEGVDRSREMYEKRVKPAVASKFDYFHYEIVNGLAEGDETKLGNGYPGPTI